VVGEARLRQISEDGGQFSNPAWNMISRHQLMFDADDLRPTAVLTLVAALVHPLLPTDVSLICPLRATTGIPCPLCGMTTSVVATVHGDLLGALAANPAGIGVVAFALIILFARGKRVTMPRVPGVLLLVSLWLFELFRFSLWPS
jgi:hypothetical protein